MNEIKFIQKLAGNQPEPTIDVADGVMRQIRRMERQAGEPKPMWLAALLSSGAAVAAILIAFQSISFFQDPFGDLLTSIWTVLR